MCASQGPHCRPCRSSQREAKQLEATTIAMRLPADGKGSSYVRPFVSGYPLLVSFGNQWKPQGNRNSFWEVQIQETNQIWEGEGLGGQTETVVPRVPFHNPHAGRLSSARISRQANGWRQQVMLMSGFCGLQLWEFAALDCLWVAMGCLWVALVFRRGEFLGFSHLARDLQEVPLPWHSGRLELDRIRQ